MRTLVPAENDGPWAVDYVIGKAEQIRRAGGRVGFTNGCFDILHPGHVEVLRTTFTCSDFTIVGLNSDLSIARIERRRLPINDERVRARMLCALRWVDAVVMFDEPTPLQLIKLIDPDVLVKGSEYNESEIVGSELVQSRGGIVMRVPMLGDYSTTGLIRLIKGRT